MAQFQGTEGPDIIAWYFVNDGVVIDPPGAGLDGDDRVEAAAGDDQVQASSGRDTLLGGDGADTLQGDADDDRLEGGAGDDALLGGSGDDLLVFAGSFGDDTVFGEFFDTGTDTLVFEGFSLADASFALLGDFGGGASLEIRTAGGSVLLYQQYDWAGASTGPTLAVFDDGTVDLTDGSLFAGRILGTGGPDFIDGTPFDDVLRGLAGDDRVNAGSGADTIFGGAGNDVLEGGAGADRYVFVAGSGRDTIYEGSDTGAADALVFRGRSVAEASFQALGFGGTTGLQVTVGTDSVALPSQYEPFSTAGRVEWAVFEDGRVNLTDGRAFLAPILGTAGHDRLEGTRWADSLDGGGGADSLRGGAGRDTLAGGAGDDTVEGGTGGDVYLFSGDFGHDVVEDRGDAADVDRLVFQGFLIADARVAVTSDPFGTNLVISIGDDSVTVQWQYSASFPSRRIEFAVFDDGVVDLKNGQRFVGPVNGTADPDRLYGTPFDERLFGYARSDVISAGDGADTLFGQGGADLLYGEAGDDTYVFARGFGRDVVDDRGLPDDVDQLVFHDIAVAEARFELIGSVRPGLRITIGDDRVIIPSQYNPFVSPSGAIEQAVFADAVVDLTDPSAFALI